MRVVLATTPDIRAIMLASDKENNCDMLISYWFLRKGTNKNFDEVLKNLKVSNKKLYIDSGVYSARKIGFEIPIEEYLQFCIKHKELDGYFFNLDQGTFEKQLNNFKLLVGNGIKAIGIINNRMTEQQIQAFIDVYPYLGISYTATGMKQSSKEYEEYLVRLFSYLKRTGQINKVKTHALGLTNPKLMQNYPFFSVDSSTWVGSERYGSLYKFDNNTITTTVNKNRKKALIKDVNMINQIKMQGDTKRDTSIYSAREFSKYQGFITKVWEGRGIKW